MARTKVSGYEDNYEIEDNGTIISLKTNNPLFTSLDYKGYKRVMLWKNNKGKLFRLHRLIALHFIPNPENKPQVNHIDGNKLNNCASNLEWTSNLENMRHAWNIGLKNNNAMKHKVIQYDNNENIIAEYESKLSAGKITGIPHQKMGQVCLGKRKTAGGFIWKSV